MSTPYQPPRSESYPTVSLRGDVRRDKLRRIATYQRLVIFALLANIAVNVASFAKLQQDLIIRLGMLALGLCVAIYTATSIVLLARELMHVVPAVFCGMAMLIPCVSLLVLLVVNQQATAFLQSHGVSVGFMGVNPAQIQ